MKQWYVLYTKPNTEYQVERTLQQHGIETFLPELKSTSQCQQQTKTPFFPCYLFVRVDLAKVNHALLKWTAGLRCIVAFDGRPVPLANDIIELIKRKLHELTANIDPTPHAFKAGDAVYINNGPFCGNLAVFEGPGTPAQRVQVLLTFLGRVARAKIDVAHLEKAPAEIPENKTKRGRRTRGKGRRIKA
jgi:transcriptional antiterminator RfaH